MEQSIEIIAANIRLLRKEARLTVEELSEKTGITVDRINEIESGKANIYTREYMLLCPILHINEDDLVERDLCKERKEALDRMNKTHNKGDFSWYYGDKKIVLFYLIGLILCLLSGIVVYSYYKFTGYLELLSKAVEELGEEPSILLDSIALKVGYLSYALQGAALPCSIMIIIEIYKRTSLKLAWWHIAIMFSLSSVIFAIGYIACIPYVFYCLYQIIIKRGRARVK